MEKEFFWRLEGDPNVGRKVSADTSICRVLLQLHLVAYLSEHA